MTQTNVTISQAATVNRSFYPYQVKAHGQPSADARLKACDDKSCINTQHRIYTVRPTFKTWTKSRSNIAIHWKFFLQINQWTFSGLGVVIGSALTLPQFHSEEGVSLSVSLSLLSFFHFFPDRPQEVSALKWLQWSGVTWTWLSWCFWEFSAVEVSQRATWQVNLVCIWLSLKP